MMRWPLLRNSIWLLLIFPLTEQVVTFSLPGCNTDKHFDIVQNQQPSLTCFGLSPGQNIYWSITDPSGQKETRLAECKHDMQGCSRLVEGYNVSREERTMTTLQFLNTTLVTDGSTMKCSRFNNKTNVTCQLYVVPAYTIPQCEKNSIKIEEGMQIPIICKGLLRLQNMFWTITYRNGTVSTVAECKACRNDPADCPECAVTNSDFHATREANSSTLVIQNNVRETDGATLRCSKRDNVTHDDCTINVESPHSKQETGLPVAAVAGGIVGFIFIVAVVIIIAVVVKRRRCKKEATQERLDTVTFNDEFEEHINEFYQSADDTDLPRHSLPNSPKPNSPAPLLLTNPTFDAQGAGSDAPQNHVYAQVNKGKKDNADGNKEKPGKTKDVKQHTKEGKILMHADKGGAVYTECVSDSKQDNSVTNVYMNVDESPPLPTDQDTHAAKKDSGNEDLQRPDPNTYYNTDTTRHQADYTNVQSVQNGAEGIMKTTGTADEYRHLTFSRREQLEENPAYDHLT